jgi:CheY-like chemotaxis protein
MRPNGKRILVVDDDHDMCELVSGILRDAGYGVAACHSPEAALSMLKRIPSPDLLVVDLRMPEMSGHELIALVRSDPKHQTVPVVILSALVTPNIATHLHAAAFLRKPFQVPDLFSTVEKLCPARA